MIIMVWGKLTAGIREYMLKERGSLDRNIFPGLIPLVLAVVGAVHLFKNGKKKRFYGWYYVILLGAAFLICLGPSLFILGHRFNMPMPFDLFYRFFPGFKSIRAPARFTVLICLCLAVLAGFGGRQIVSS